MSSNQCFKSVSLIAWHCQRPLLSSGGPFRWQLYQQRPRARVFVTSSSLRRDTSISGKPRQDIPLNDVKSENAAALTPENVEKPKLTKAAGSAPLDPLLSEQIISNKEQRKADWAIMKEMAKYLWPKVCILYPLPSRRCL